MEKGKVILYIAMSLDGFISRDNGAIDWLGGQGDVLEPDFGYEQFISTIDTVVMGWKTYHQVANELSPDVWVYPNQKALIVTSRSEALPTGRECVRPNQIVDVVEAERQAGRHVWLVGGAQTIVPFLEKDLIDEYVITIIPTLLGSGVRLFTANEQQDLRLVSQKVIDGMVMLTYHRR
ncbi:MAG: dihydrofolate reductase family protein [Culicoidibacterales bacterium]